MKRELARQGAAKSGSALLFALLGLLSLVGCADDDHSGSNSSGGGASSAGAAGKGGGGSAGGGNQAPPIFGCDGESAFQPNAQIVRSCILRAGCDPTFAPVRTISNCVTYNTQAALAGERCNLSAMTCADYEACEHVGIAHDDLCGGGQTTRCQGNLAINCGNYTDGDRFFDCAALGGTCGTLTDQDTLFADCKLAISPDSCAGLPNTDAETFCHLGSGKNDDLRYYCWDGQAFGASCSSLASCIDAPDASSNEGGAGNASELGNAQCFFDTVSCSGGDSVSCDGDVVTVCSEGSEFKYDCGSVGLSCSTTAKTAYCLAPGCNAADVTVVCHESCSDDASSLTLCYGGLPYTVSCADYGFSRCSSDTDPASGQTVAACRF
ncbi:MAG TPA: hypothetical protein VGC79_19445 [Polyangiaceae bacterium]